MGVIAEMNIFVLFFIFFSFLFSLLYVVFFFFFFFQAEDGIRDLTVTGVQTCALPILLDAPVVVHTSLFPAFFRVVVESEFGSPVTLEVVESQAEAMFRDANGTKIGRASCRERV